MSQEHIVTYSLTASYLLPAIYFLVSINRRAIKDLSWEVFLLHMLFRALSGIQNGLFYGRQLQIMLLVSLFMVGLIVYMYKNLKPKSRNKWIQRVYVALLLSSLIATAIMVYVLWFRMYHYIHLVEYFVTGGVALSLMLVDWKAALLSGYIGLVLHKIGVNLPSGLPWNYNGTDDPTGSTVGVYIFGWLIHLPRTNFKTRLIIAGACFAIFVGYKVLWPAIKRLIYRLKNRRK